VLPLRGLVGSRVRFFTTNGTQLRCYKRPQKDFRKKPIEKASKQALY
jgi:hypothetical protein